MQKEQMELNRFAKTLEETLTDRNRYRYDNYVVLRQILAKGFYRPSHDGSRKRAFERYQRAGMVTEADVRLSERYSLKFAAELFTSVKLVAGYLDFVYCPLSNTGWEYRIENILSSAATSESHYLTVRFIHNLIDHFWTDPATGVVKGTGRKTGEEIAGTFVIRISEHPRRHATISTAADKPPVDIDIVVGNDPTATKAAADAALKELLHRDTTWREIAFADARDRANRKLLASGRTALPGHQHEVFSLPYGLIWLDEPWAQEHNAQYLADRFETT